MEKDGQPTRFVSRLHAATSQKPGPGLRTAPNTGQLILPGTLFEATLAGLCERSAGWRESAAIWVGRVIGNKWIAEAVHFHHELGDDHARALSLELSEAAKLRLYAALAAQGQRVVALIHTHPGDWVGLSEIDERNQVGSRVGFWSLVVPQYAQQPWRLETFGVHIRCESGWARVDEEEISQRVRIS
jgi:proteasome lid subunit RPN8/RPN11